MLLQPLKRVPAAHACTWALATARAVVAKFGLETSGLRVGGVTTGNDSKRKRVEISEREKRSYPSATDVLAGSTQ